MKLFKNYKKLYKQQMNNNAIMNERNIDLGQRYVKYQEDAIAKQKKFREEIARLKIEIEDIKGFLEQEKAVSATLRKEKAALKRKITILEKEKNKDGK